MQLEQQQPRDSLPRLLRDWSLRPVLQADLQLVVALQLALGRALLVAPELPAVAEAVLVLDL
jgi:hypothetical protein